MPTIVSIWHSHSDSFKIIDSFSDFEIDCWLLPCFKRPTDGTGPPGMSSSRLLFKYSEISLRSEDIKGNWVVSLGFNDCRNIEIFLSEENHTCYILFLTAPVSVHFNSYFQCLWFLGMAHRQISILMSLSTTSTRDYAVYYDWMKVLKNEDLNVNVRLFVCSSFRLLNFIIPGQKIVGIA